MNQSSRSCLQISIVVLGNCVSNTQNQEVHHSAQTCKLVLLSLTCVFTPVQITHKLRSVKIHVHINTILKIIKIFFLVAQAHPNHYYKFWTFELQHCQFHTFNCCYLKEFWGMLLVDLGIFQCTSSLLFSHLYVTHYQCQLDFSTFN